MGGSGSTRRIIVEDSGKEDVVKISEAVLTRLKTGQPGEAGSKTSAIIPSTISQSDDSPAPRPLPTEVEDFYVEKLQELQERTAALQKHTNEHFAKAVKEVEDKFMNYTASPVCLDLQSKVLECYQANPSETLNCSALVNAFTSCVDRARMAASTSRLQTVS